MKLKIGLIITLVLVATIGAISLKKGPTPNVNLLVSPSVASIRLDNNKNLSIGKIYVAPGQHSLVVSFAGFATQQTTITVKQGSVLPLYILLSPNSATGQDWLNKHPKETNNRQAVSGALFSNSTDKRLEKYPIIKDLPFVSPGDEYRIDYGVDPANKNSDAVGLYITYYTSTGKQDALNWITQDGYNPSNFTITYYDKTSEYQPTDNPYTN